MRIRSLIGVLAALALEGPGTMPRLAAAPLACESLGQVALTNGKVLSVETVQAGAFTPPTPANAAPAAVYKTVPAFCRVTAQLTPTPDSDIRVDVWLPVSGWNRKLQAVGNGGLGGFDSVRGPRERREGRVRRCRGRHGARRRQRGFLKGHPEKLVDFGHRAIHEMTVTAKAVTTAHYDTRPAGSYFNACSTGGRQALIEAQRYPEDFDGIVAGDPSWDQMRSRSARGPERLHEPQPRGRHFSVSIR